MKTVNIASIGCGRRGSAVIKLFASVKGAHVSAVCDLSKDRADKVADEIRDEYKTERPDVYTDYKEMFKSKIDAVLIATSWETHIPLSIEAMKHGIIALSEVCGSRSLDACFELVKTYEETKTPIMLLENCCYGKDELLATALMRNGLFGTVVHCDGEYGHDIRDGLTNRKDINHYRLQNYLNYCCENYPTHELGPIAKLLGINRGNRMISLVSVASKEAGFTEYVRAHEDDLPHLKGRKFAQGDIITTLIRCANGETIRICLDTSHPRHYNRSFTVRGTKGLYEQGCNMVYLDGMKEEFDTVETYRMNMDNGKQYEDKYLCDIWKNITKEEMENGHGGMDFLMCSDVVKRIREGRELPIDVYDMASWMAVTVLSEKSISEGGTLQEFPDFTHGEWKNRPVEDVTELPKVMLDNMPDA